MPSRTIWRKPLLLAALAAAIPLPLVVAGLTRSMPTERLARTYLEGGREVLERKYGPSIYEEYTRYFNTLDTTPVTIPLSMPILNSFQNADAPAASDEVAWLEQQNRDIFAYYDELAPKGKAWDWPEEEPKPDESFRVPNFLSIQVATKLRTALAVQAAGRGDWEGALDHADGAAHLSDPAQGSYLIGHLIAVAGRAIAYGGYARLLDFQPDAAQSREAALRLKALAATDPVYDEAVLIAESGMLVHYLLNMQGPDRMPKWVANNYAGTMIVLEALSTVSEQADEIEDPSTRDWIKRRTRGYEYDNYVPPALSLTIPWTRLGAAREVLQNLGEEQPGFGASSTFAGTAVDKLPPGERIFVQPSTNANLSEVAVRSRTARTMGRLVQAGYAARVFHAESGSWPTDLALLDPELFPELPPGSDERNAVDDQHTRAWLANQAPFGPFHAAMVPVDDKTAELVASQILRRGRQFLAEAGMVRGMTTTLRAGEGGQWHVEVGTPLTIRRGEETGLAYLRQSLLASPAGHVKEVEILTGEGRAVGDEELKAWGDAELADNWNVTVRASERIFPDIPPYVQEAAERRDNAVVLNHMRIRMELPDELYVIWSEGPDGDNDGARTVYDPTNGTVSDGDLVVFPGGL